MEQKKAKTSKPKAEPVVVEKKNKNEAAAKPAKSVVAKEKAAVAANPVSDVVVKSKPTVAPNASAHPRLKLKQVASGAGRLRAQNATLKGLGLGKLNRVVELEDTPAIRGMVRKVHHLVQVVE